MPPKDKHLIQDKGKDGMAKGEVGNSITFIDGTWQEGSPKVLGPDSNAMWLSSIVFDGARAMLGGLPDLDKHCARVTRSAEALGMNSPMTGEEFEALAREGIAKFEDNAQLYVCPMIWAEDGFMVAEPDSTRCLMSIYRAPLPDPNGFSACRTAIRRPARDQAPTDAKASCLYPNVARAVREARDKGFDTGIVLDPAGNVAEFAYTNLLMVKDGAIHTPAPNGTFLNGLTRQRVIQLLRDDGHDVVERAIRYDELAEVDELFSTANYSKVLPCTKLDDRDIQPGPIFSRARELYWEFAANS